MVASGQNVSFSLSDQRQHFLVSLQLIRALFSSSSLFELLVFLFSQLHHFLVSLRSTKSFPCLSPISQMFSLSLFDQPGLFIVSLRSTRSFPCLSPINSCLSPNSQIFSLSLSKQSDLFLVSLRTTRTFCLSRASSHTFCLILSDQFFLISLWPVKAFTLLSVNVPTSSRQPLLPQSVN